PLAAAKALASFAPDPKLPAHLRVQRKTAKPPRFARLRKHIARSTARGSRLANMVLLPATRQRESACPSSAAPAALPSRSAPSVVLRHCGYQPFGKLLRHAVQRRVLLFKKTFYVGGDLVFIPKNEIVV